MCIVWLADLLGCILLSLSCTEQSNQSCFPCLTDVTPSYQMCLGENKTLLVSYFFSRKGFCK